MTKLSGFDRKRQLSFSFNKSKASELYEDRLRNIPSVNRERSKSYERSEMVPALPRQGVINEYPASDMIYEPILEEHSPPPKMETTSGFETRKSEPPHVERLKQPVNAGLGTGIGITNHEAAIEPNQFDRWLLIITMGLVLIGFFMVYSSTAIVAPGKKDNLNDSLIQLYYLKKQAVSLLIGIAFMIFTMKLDSKVLKNNAIYVLIIAAVSLIMVVVPGVGSNVKGATRWIKLSIFSIQPSEFVKIAMVIFLARYLSGAYYRPEKVSSFLQPIFVMAVVQGLLMLQPDFGSAAIIGMLTIMLLFASGTRVRFIGSLLIALIPIIIKLVLEPYRLKRIMIYLNPWSAPASSGFQLVQSLYALGIGGFDGVGIGKSTQKLFFLPESKTDFIFAIIAEETGLIGAVFIVILFMLFFLRGLSIIQRTKDKFSFFLAIGITYLIVIQAIINICVVCGLVPTKGLALPFISYGGSSLIANLISVGLLLNVSTRTTYSDTANNDITYTAQAIDALNMLKGHKCPLGGKRTTPGGNRVTVVLSGARQRNTYIKRLYSGRKQA